MKKIILVLISIFVLSSFAPAEEFTWAKYEILCFKFGKVPTYEEYEYLCENPIDFDYDDIELIEGAE